MHDIFQRIAYNKTVDELFEGTTAEEAKIRAANIARLILFKIDKNSLKG